MKITELRTNHMENPLGFALGTPVFSWKVEAAEGKHQAAARVRVFEDEKLGGCVFDTGEAELDSLAVPCALPLKPRTRYWWTVWVRTDCGEEMESAPAWFETAKRDEPWAGRWIGLSQENQAALAGQRSEALAASGAFGEGASWSPEGLSAALKIEGMNPGEEAQDKGPKPGSMAGRHPEFFRLFETEKPAVRARLYISGLGLYEAELDGARVGDEYLAPDCNAYDSWVQYQSYDVTAQLAAPGAHRLSVLLGNGWYKGRFGFKKTEGRGWYGNDWKLIAELRILFADGSEQVIASDGRWQVCGSGITFSGIYDGEHRDDTLPETPVFAAVFAEAPQGRLEARRSLPVRAHERISPVELIRTPAGELVLDLGQNFAGIFEFRVHAPRGQVVRLQFGEILQNGNFYRDNLRSAMAEYYYVSGGETALLRPRFTFYGYRYVKITGAEQLQKEDFTALALYSDIREAGTVRTGHALVNRLLDNVRWGLKGNFVDVPTDCPQRDERMGWTGDAQVFSATACYLEESCAFYSKYLYDMYEEQEKQGGRVPHVIPAVGETQTSAVWGDAACIIPWNLYRFYGDRTLLEEQYPGMEAWVDFISGQEAAGQPWGAHFHYGDWLALDNLNGKADEVFGRTDVAYIAYIYYMYSAELTARAAEVLGKPDRAAFYRALAARVRAGVKERYFDADGRCRIETQTALVLALRFELACGEKATTWTRKRLRGLLAENGGRLNTGFTGTPLLGPELSENGMEALAWKLFLNEEYPGWLYEVKLGATTVWERWNSVLADGSISSTGMNSLNHYAYGSIAEWVFAYAAGIRQQSESVGFRQALLAPQPNPALGALSAVYDAAAGRYSLSWHYAADGALELSTAVPFGCTAELILPAYRPGSLRHADGSPVSAAEPLHAALESGRCTLPAGVYGLRFRTD